MIFQKDALMPLRSNLELRQNFVILIRKGNLNHVKEISSLCSLQNNVRVYCKEIKVITQGKQSLLLYL